MPYALPFTDRISKTSTLKTKFDTKSVKLGHGYSTAAPAGINNSQDTWSITFDALSLTEYNSLCTVFDAVQNWDYLTWQAPGDGASKRWKISADGYSASTAGIYWYVSITLEQTY
jgi:phage-related protein